MKVGQFAMKLHFIAIIIFALCFVSISHAQLGGIRGAVYNDMNGNGIRDAVDVGKANVPFTIVGPAGYRTIVSNSEGNFLAMDLPSGPYTVLPPLYGHGTLVTESPIGVINFDVPPGNIHDFAIGFHETCVKFDREKIEIVWQLDSSGVPTGNAYIVLHFQNENPWDIGYAYVTPQTPGVTVLTGQPLTPTGGAAGQNGYIAFLVSGANPETGVCFNVAFHEPLPFFRCCEERICFDMPDCECYQEVGQQITCQPNGDFLVTLAIQILFDPPGNAPISQIWVWSPGDPSPQVFNVGLQPSDFWTFQDLISNPSYGGTIQCFTIGLFAGGQLCCVKDLCLRFPICKQCDNRPAICYATRPEYDARDAHNQPYNTALWNQVNGKTVAAVSCYGFDPYDYQNLNLNVIAYMNLANYQCFPPPFGTDWALTPRGFHNGYQEAVDPDPGTTPPNCRWTKQYLGSVYALTFDNERNLYVAQSSCFNNDYAPLISDYAAPNTGRTHVPFSATSNEALDPTGQRLHGRIFKIENGTGRVSIFNEDSLTVWNGMPSGSDPSITTGNNTFSLCGESYPEIGDITFDFDHNKIFATCMDDGKIYRFSMGGVKEASYDPFVADTTTNAFGDGFAGLGEVVWALKYHQGRLYFSRWVEDFTNVSPLQNEENSVYSIQIGSGGAFPPTGSEVKELQIDPLPTGTGVPGSTDSAMSPLISDITFSKEIVDGVERGFMIIAERGMGAMWQGPPQISAARATGANAAFTNTFPHRARGWKFGCNEETRTWERVGNASPNGSLHWVLGGLDSSSSGAVDFDFDTGNCTPPGNRAWFMEDYYSAVWYGLQGVRMSGDTGSTSIFIDLDGIGTSDDKTLNGDVEIPCPSKGGVGGTVSNDNWPPPPNMAVIIRPEGLPAYERTVPIGPNGEFIINDLDPVPTTIRFKSAKTLGKSHTYPLQNGPISNAQVNLVLGDIENDNEINLIDYGRLAGAFGSLEGGGNWDDQADLDCDGEVNLADFGILAGNFGMQGDE